MTTKTKGYNLLEQMDRMIASDEYGEVETTILGFGQRVGKCRNDEQRRVVWSEIAEFEKELKESHQVPFSSFEVEFSTLRRALQGEL